MKRSTLPPFFAKNSCRSSYAFHFPESARSILPYLNNNERERRVLGNRILFQLAQQITVTEEKPLQRFPLGSMTAILTTIFCYVIHQILMNAQVIARRVTRKPCAPTQLVLTSVRVTMDTLEMVGHFA